MCSPRLLRSKSRSHDSHRRWTRSAHSRIHKTKTLIRTPGTRRNGRLAESSHEEPNSGDSQSTCHPRHSLLASRHSSTKCPRQSPFSSNTCRRGASRTTLDIPTFPYLMQGADAPWNVRSGRPISVLNFLSSFKTICDWNRVSQNAVLPLSTIFIRNRATVIFDSRTYHHDLTNELSGGAYIRTVTCQLPTGHVYHQWHHLRCSKQR